MKIKLIVLFAHSFLNRTFRTLLGQCGFRLYRGDENKGFKELRTGRNNRAMPLFSHETEQNPQFNSVQFSLFRPSLYGCTYREITTATKNLLTEEVMAEALAYVTIPL